MRKLKGITLGRWVYISLVLFFLASWAVNLNKFCKLDFEPNYKAEFIRGTAVLLWPVAGVVAWMDVGEETEGKALDRHIHKLKHST